MLLLQRKYTKIYNHRYAALAINILFKFTGVCKFRNRFKYLFIRKGVRIFLEYPSWLFSYWCSYLAEAFKQLFDIFPEEYTKKLMFI